MQIKLGKLVKKALSYGELCTAFNPIITPPITGRSPSTPTYPNPRSDPTIPEEQRGHPLSFTSPYRSAHSPPLSEPTLLG